MRLTPQRAVRLAAAGLLAAVVAACGGTGEPVADYVTATAAITEQMTRDAFAALPPGAAPTYDQISAVVAARREALDAIGALAPPEEMAPEHLALVTAMGEFVTATETFVASAADLDTAAFLTALEASTDLDVLADVVSGACTTWESRAADLGQPVELGC
ncbi:MAG TPA: hypothetical protein DCY40_05365 [Actinobacteria bacterium]|nr:hypothetical protein [Actinomycetota bacterium]